MKHDTEMTAKYYRNEVIIEGIIFYQVTFEDIERATLLVYIYIIDRGVVNSGPLHKSLLNQCRLIGIWSVQLSVVVLVVVKVRLPPL